MGVISFKVTILAVATVSLIGISGCSKKSVQSGGDTRSSEQRVPQSQSKDMPESGVGSFPETSLQSANSGLRGLDKSPSEERVGSELGGIGSGMQGNGAGTAGSGGGSGAESGTLLAKADPSDSSHRQVDEMRAEQAASAAAGLRDVFFGYDSWTITEDGRQALSVNAEWMKANKGALVKVEGHCDERGTAAYNLVLGEKRAKAVRNYLVELGVSPNRLSVVSYGKERPFCNEHEESCYQQNRRGHLVVRSGK